MRTGLATFAGQREAISALPQPSLSFESYFGLLRMLASQGHRPNLLVAVGRGMATDATARRVITLGVLPFHWCALPGQLLLPSKKAGTLFLNDVAALGRDQQIALHDWLSVGADDLQTISITSVPLQSLVEDAQFLVPLSYPLNVVR